MWKMECPWKFDKTLWRWETSISAPISLFLYEKTLFFAEKWAFFILFMKELKSKDNGTCEYDKFE